MKAAGDAISPFGTMIEHFDRFFGLERKKFDPLFTKSVDDLLRHPQRAKGSCSNDEHIGAVVERPLEIVDVKPMPLSADPGREGLVSKQDEIPRHRPIIDLHVAEAVRRQLSHENILAAFAALWPTGVTKSS
jgi:hypothetical protein